MITSQSWNFSQRVFIIPKKFLYLLWVIEYLIQLLGIRKRFLTRAIISSQYDHKTINGNKIKSFINFEYSKITNFIFD